MIPSRALALLLCGLTACSAKPKQQPTDAGATSVFEILEVGTPDRITLTTDGYVTEIPPWLLEGRVLVSSSSSALCRIEGVLAAFMGGVGFDCQLLSAGTLSPTISEEDLAAIPPWRRNYHALFSIHDAGDLTLAVGHGENKNERIDQRVFLNTINLDVGADCVSGPNPVTNTYDDCWESYNSFVTLSQISFHPDGSPSLVKDLGPLAWPTAGLVDGQGAKQGLGLRHPSSIIDQGWLYVFFMDESWGTEPFEKQGIRVVRAALDPTPVPAAFRAFVDGGFDEPALPMGFEARRMLDFIGQRGPPALPLFSEPDVSSVRFSVARARGTQWFVGAEERTEADGSWSIALRISTDLVHWSEPAFHPGLRATSWDTARLNYPIFLDARGQTNTEIEADDFFLLGTGGSELHRAHLRVSLPQ